MIKRAKATNVGDIFEVKVSDIGKKYMQYIANDLSQLNSDVVRGFSKIYNIEAKPSLQEIYGFHDSSRQIDLKRLDKDSLPSYLSDGIFNYSLTYKRDYFQEFLGKTVGVIKESDADKDTTSKKGRICITDENELSM